MVKSTRWMFLIALLVISSMLLSACGGESPTATTGTGGGAAAATDTPAAAAPAATDTPAAAAGAATDTPAAAGAATPTEAMASTPASGGGAAGLGQPFDPSTYKKNAVEDGATLRVSGWGDTSEQQVNRDAFARFEKVYPNVKLNYEPQPDQYETKLKAQIKGGSEPDVFYVSPALSAELIDAGVLMDLAPALQEVGRSKDDYFPSLIDYMVRDNKVYGVPKDFGSLAIFYATDLVAKANAQAPKEGWTQDDFTNFVKSLTQGTDPNTKVYGTITAADSHRWLAFAMANGAKLIDNKKCVVNSPEAVATLDWWYGMYKDKIAAQASDVGAGWSGEAFAKGRSASAIEGGWLIPFLANPTAGFSNLKYDVVSLPVGKAGKADLIFTNSWGASAKTKYPKAAAALALFLASRENQDAVLQTGFALPTLKGMEEDPYFKGSGVANKASALLYQTASYGTNDYFGPNDAQIHKAVDDALQRVFAGQQGSKDALDQACQEIDPLVQ